MPKNPTFSIERLWQGEASTAPWTRRNGQIEDSTNVRFDVRVGGAVKRNAFVLVSGKLFKDDGTTVLPGSEHFYWTAIRNALVAIGDGEVYGWNMETGAELTLQDNSPQGSQFTETGSSFYEYITSGPNYNARRDIRVTSNFDTIIVANDDVSVATTDAFTFQESANFLTNGDPDDNTTGSPPTAAEASVSPLDVFSDFYGLAEVEGDVFQIKLSEEGNPSGWYIRFAGTVDSGAEGYFPDHHSRFRIPDSGQAKGRYDPTTMPHRIVYDEDNQKLILDQCPWKQRVSGNESTNKAILKEQSIASVDFLDGRLMLVTRSGINVGSRKNDYFNLWNDNVNAISDNDRIVDDAQTSGTGATLSAAICGNGMIIITENKVLAFGPPVDESITALNVSTHVLQDMQMRNMKPGAASGVCVAMDKFRDLHQFTWTNQGIVYSGLLTAHNRDALDNMDDLSDIIHQIETTTIVTDSSGSARTHELFDVGSEVVQSAWGALDGGDDGLAFLHPWNGRFYVVTRDSTEGYSLMSYEHMQQLTETPKLNRMETIEPSQMTYDAGDDQTTMSHSERDGNASTSRFVQDWTVHEPVEVLTNGDVVFAGDLTGADGDLGFTFDCDMTLTQVYPAMTAEGYSVTRLFVFHFETTEYTMQWWTDAANTKSNTFDATDGVFDTFYKEFEVRGDPRTMTFKLTSNNPHPCTWLGVEYEYKPEGTGRP